MQNENSLIKSLVLLSEQERTKFLNSLSEKEAEDLLYDWTVWARPHQLPPPGEWLTWMILTGRGWGKTRCGAEWVIDCAKKGATHIALIGQTKADVRDTMIELGPASILKISNPKFYPKYESSKRRIVWPNGCVGTIYSGDEPDQVRGPSHDRAWIDELAKFKYPQDIWDNLMFGLREGEDMRVLITTTPRPIPIIKRLIEDPNTISVRGSTYENKDNLPKKYFDYVIAPYVGTRLGKQEIEGHILDDNPDALWTRKIIDDNRKNKFPELVRVVIAVDPEATANEKSSETGIIAIGVCTDGHGWLLGDESLRGTPDKWGNAVVAAYNKYNADRIIGEVNNGGDMIEYVIKTVDPRVSYKSVRASRGKYIRAEPVAALYEQGKIHHIGNFPELEDQLCEWVPGDKSPDRLDALVWGVTELMLDEVGDPYFYVPE
ncbi:MAG: terminase family protein [Bacteroidetes bacterium]|nr:terminase family protein [Bacteroidota bacterium]